MSTITEKVFNFKKELQRFGILKSDFENHEVENQQKFNDIEESIKELQNTNLTIDSVLKPDSSNPVQNRAINSAIKTSQNYLQTQIDDIANKVEKTVETDNLDLGATNDFDTLSNRNAGVFYLNYHGGTPGLENLTSWVTPSDNKAILKVDHYPNDYDYVLQHLIFPSTGQEYKRYCTDGEWTPWKLSYSRKLININKNIGLQSLDTNAHITIWEDHNGYIIAWDQRDNSGNATSFNLSQSNYNWQKVAQFSKKYIDLGTSDFVFSNKVGCFDIKIKSDAIQIRRACDGVTKINGITHLTWFVPKAPINTW